MERNDPSSTYIYMMKFKARHLILSALLAFVFSTQSLAASSNQNTTQQTSQTKLSQTVATDLGDITLPLLSELNEVQKEVASDSSLDEATRNDRAVELENAKTNLNNAQSYLNEINELKKTLRQSSQTIRSLSSTLYKDEKQYQEIPSVDTLTLDEIGSLVENNRQLSAKAQSDYIGKTADYNNLQTLTERAQNTITKNNQRISDLNRSLSNEHDTSSLSSKIKALEIYTLGLQNALLQTELANHTELLDIANYRMRIAALKNTYYQNYLEALLDKQNKLLQADTDSISDEELNKIAKNHPELQSELKTNAEIQGFIVQYKQSSATLASDAHQVESALSTVKQLSESVQNEISSLDKSLLLSRLLNHQQDQIPSIKLSQKLDELIPELTIWLYDLRAGRDKLFDINAYADSLIAKNHDLQDARESLINVVIKRRQLLNELYQAMSSQLTTAINLKVKYEEFVDIRNKTTNLITENLFWLKSNQPVGRDFFLTLIPSISSELSSFGTQLQDKEYWSATATTMLTIVVPAMIIACILFLLGPRIRRINNHLAGRLDRKNDSVLVTPFAILLNFIMVLPKALIWVLAGTVIICMCLSTTTDQLEVIGMLLLHILVFVYLLEILRPNSLAQRHFSMNPDALYQDRKLLTGIWYALIPILIVANIVETKSSGIYSDPIGFIVMIICALSMVVVSFRWLRSQLHSTDSMSSALWFISVAGFIAPLAIAIAVAYGYYYTTIKLVNRVAYTCYTVLGYWLISNTLRRAVYVFQSKIQRKNYALNEQDNESSPKEETNLSFFKETLGLENLSAKAFKLINAVLIVATVFFMYLQWSDLAGALGYLKNIVLWSHSEISGGKEIIVNTLTMADILLAIIIIAITMLLNRNLPSLLERMFLWKAVGAQHRSTSYTVKIITSYIIIALGTIFAAGAIGIKWENLQWLVAALSVGLGFGLQEIFANFVSGIIILFERQIRVGDIITLGDLSGTVNRIRIRSTTILSFENKEVMIPNRNFITSALTNWSLTNTVTKLEFSVGIGYGADVNKAKQLLSNIIRKCRYTAKGMAPLIYVASLDDSAVTIKCELYVAEIGKRKLANDYLCTTTLAEFAKYGIEIPFNQMDVNIKNLEQGEFLEAFKQGQQFAKDGFSAKAQEQISTQAEIKA